MVFGGPGPDSQNTRSLAAKACGGRWRRAFWGAEERRACALARSATRQHSRRGCLNAESAANAVSSATGRKTEHRRAVGAFSARPPQRSDASGPHTPLQPPRQIHGAPPAARRANEAESATCARSQWTGSCPQRLPAAWACGRRECRFRLVGRSAPGCMEHGRASIQSRSASKARVRHGHTVVVSTVRSTMSTSKASAASKSGASSSALPRTRQIWLAKSA